MFIMISIVRTRPAPNSFSMTQNFFPCCSVRMRLSSVVLPEPRNPAAYQELNKGYCCNKHAAINCCWLPEYIYHCQCLRARRRLNNGRAQQEAPREIKSDRRHCPRPCLVVEAIHRGVLPQYYPFFINAFDWFKEFQI